MLHKRCCSVQSAVPRLGHMILTLDHHLQLGGDLSQFSQDLLIAVSEVQTSMLDTSLFTELADQYLQAPEVMARYTGEQMVYSLELKTSMYKVQPRRAFDVHRGSQLALRETLGFAEVAGGHCPV